MRRLRVRSLSLTLTAGEVVSRRGISSSGQRRPFDESLSIPGLECREDGDTTGGSKRF